MTRDDALILAGFRHAVAGGWPGDCPETDPADRLLWMEGFLSHHMRAIDPGGLAADRLAALRQRAMGTYLNHVLCNDNAETDLCSTQ